MSQFEAQVQTGLKRVTSLEQNSRVFPLRDLLVPRPLSFLANTILFGGGILFAWLEGYRGNLGINQTGGAMLRGGLLLLTWFVIQEFLVQQAKYLWNDIRDHKRDQDIPANRARPAARRTLTRQISFFCGSRWALGLILAALFSSKLLAVVLTITVLQIVYELWAKSMAFRYPLAPLFIVAAGSVLKFIGGGLAMGWAPGDHRLWIYGLAFFGTGVVYASNLWRLEALHFTRRGRSYPRGQSPYFQAKGLAWMHMGAVLGAAAGLILLADGFLRFLDRSEAPVMVAITVMVAGGAACCLLLFALTRFDRRLPFIAPLLLAVVLLGTAFFQEDQQPFLAAKVGSSLLLLLLLLVDYRFNYSTDYRQYNLLHWQEKWPALSTGNLTKNGDQLATKRLFSESIKGSN